MPILNPHISVDCVIFAFDSSQIKVLLIEREGIEGVQIEGHRLKLPGSPIYKKEDLDLSASRVLRELTGLSNIFLKQFAVFGDVDRLSPHEDLEWLRKTSNNPDIERIVTVSYYSLIKLTESIRTPKTIWCPIKDLPELIFDHNKIIEKAFRVLREEFRTRPLCFELLPRKFTIRQMQNVYEAILREELDSRNFRKKIKPYKFIVPLDEKEKDVNHKPAQLFRFDKRLYEQYRKSRNGFIL